MSAEFDQQMAQVRDELPCLWLAVYKGSLDAGFNAYQALSLTQTFILATMGKGTIPNNPDAPPEKE